MSSFQRCLLLKNITLFCVSIILYTNLVDSITTVKPTQTTSSTSKPLPTLMPDPQNPTADDLQRNIIFRFFKK